MARVVFEHVYKRFGDVEAVADLDIEIEDKEFLVFVGPSGCGKSTSLRMLAGLEEITEGRIIIGERVVNNVPPKDRDIAMVFQSYALYPHMTVYDNIAFGLRLRKTPKQIIDERVHETSESYFRTTGAASTSIVRWSTSACCSCACHCPRTGGVPNG
jgi:multiple sugar transport system ATP-binding protein